MKEEILWIFAHPFRWIRWCMLMLVLFLGIFHMQAGVPFALDSTLWKDSLFHYEEPALIKNKSFVRAASEVFGLNIGLWAFDRFALKGHYAYISLKTIGANFRHGFEWDNDHLNTNMFAHPYNGSLYFNAARSNGFNLMNVRKRPN